MNPNKPDAAAEEKKTDFQIAWELSQTRDKPFFVDTFRKLLSLYDKEEISLSKVVEELNIAAYKWQSSQSGKDDMTAKEFYAALDGILTFDFLNPEEQQTIFDFAELYAKGKLRQSGKERAALEKIEVDDLQNQVREHIKQHDLFDWHEALSNEEMIYLENLLLTFAPMFSPGSIGFEKTVRPYLQALSTDVGEQDKWRNLQGIITGHIGYTPSDRVTITIDVFGQENIFNNQYKKGDKIIIKHTNS